MSTSVWRTVNTEFDLIQAELDQNINSLAVTSSLHLSADRALTKKLYYAPVGITIDTAEYTLSLQGVVWQAASNEKQLIDAVKDSAVTNILVTSKIELTSDRVITKALFYTSGAEILTNGYLLTLTDPYMPGPYQQFGKNDILLDANIEISGNLTVDEDVSVTGDATVDGSVIADSVVSGVFYIGDPLTNGSWRMVAVGNNLAAQRRESGSWVTKGNFTP